MTPRLKLRRLSYHERWAGPGRALTVMAIGAAYAVLAVLAWSGQ
jgi:hypothetical protein